MPFAMLLLALQIIRWRRTDSGTLKVDRWRMVMPVAGPLHHQMLVAQTCKSLSLMLAAGIPLKRALEIVEDVIDNRYYMTHAVQPLLRGLVEGQSMAESIGRIPLYSRMLVGLVEEGEQTGTLGPMLRRAAAYMEGEVHDTVDRILAAVEPCLMVVMGIVVTFVLLGIFLPLYSMLGSIS